MILIVDDDAQRARLIGLVCQRHLAVGVDIQTFYNEQDAGVWVEKGVAPRIAFVDLCLTNDASKMEGRSILKALGELTSSTGPACFRVAVSSWESASQIDDVPRERFISLHATNSDYRSQIEAVLDEVFGTVPL